ncbi:YuzL family protein [Fredinandcohnia humi]
MPKRKKDPSKVGLNSPDVEGQGTTEQETGNMKMDSSRRKQKRT